MHARALKPAHASPLSALLDRPVREMSGTVEFRYDGAAVHAHKGSDVASMAFEWVFGAGTLAFTPVGQRNGRWVEHRVSWYSASQRPGMTLGKTAASVNGQEAKPRGGYQPVGSDYSTDAEQG